MKPTVGRIVHFYTSDPAKQFNGQGEGPYPAIITQCWTGTMVNLKVLHWGGSFDEGSVSHQDDTQKGDHNRYWVWPPRE